MTELLLAHNTTWTEILLAIFAGFALAALYWRLISGKWLPDGSYAASMSPSGIDWNKVNQAIDEGRLDDVRKSPEKFRARGR